jgi:spermidine/putrescine transport system permease protein
MKNRFSFFDQDSVQSIIAAFAIGWQLVFFYLPLVCLLVLSLLDISAFFEFFHFSFFKVLSRSFFLAFGNATLCLCIGYPFAWWIATRSPVVKQLSLFFLIVPFWTNFLLHIFAWFFVLEREGFLNVLLLKYQIISSPLHVLNSLVAVMIMMVYYYLPFMVLPIFASLERFDKKLIEASLDLGATKLQTFKRIIVPQTENGIYSGFFLVFVPSFGEFVIPELMGGDKRMFAGSVVSHYILNAHTMVKGAVFVVLFVTLLLVASFICYRLLQAIVKAFGRGTL